MFLRLFILTLLGTLPAFAGSIQVVNEQNFDQEIKSGVVLVEFYGPWCGPCKRLSPVLDKIADNLPEGKKIVKVNIDQSKDLAKQYDVSGVPTMILFKKGKEAGRLVGGYDQQSIEDFINSK